MQKLGFSPAKKFLRMDQGIEITGRDRETERISVQYFFKSMRYRFTSMERIRRSVGIIYISKKGKNVEYTNQKRL